MSRNFEMPSKKETLKNKALYVVFGIDKELKFIRVENIKDYDDDTKIVYLDSGEALNFNCRYLTPRTLIDCKDLQAAVIQIRKDKANQES